MSEVTRLVCSIIQFLREQLQCGNLSPEAAESVEVAIQCLEQAYNLRNDNPPQPSRSLLDVFTAASDPDQSRTSPTEASPDKKRDAECLKNRGNELMKCERFTEAVTCYTRAIEFDGRNAIYFCNRAAAYSKLNQHHLAIIDCEKAILIDVKYCKAYGRKGLAHASLGQHKEAKECYEKAVQLDPQNESYRSNLQIAQEKLREANLNSQPNQPPGNAATSPTPGMFGMDASGFNLSNLLSNPALLNMATQVMSDPSMQQLLGNFLSGSIPPQGAGAGTGPSVPTSEPANTDGPPSGPAPAPAPGPGVGATAGTGGPQPPGVQALLQAGQQLAAQMQASNPELVEQLRRQLGSGGPGNPPSSQSRDNGQTK